MEHKDKVKLALRMSRTKEEVDRKTSRFDTKAWADRKASIKARIEKRTEEIRAKRLKIKK
jgi:hypothetical protein